MKRKTETKLLLDGQLYWVISISFFPTLMYSDRLQMLPNKGLQGITPLT